MKKAALVIDELVREVSEVKNSGRVDHATIHWALDGQGLHVEISMTAKGVAKKVACIYPLETEDIVGKILHKIDIILR